MTDSKEEIVKEETPVEDQSVTEEKSENTQEETPVEEAPVESKEEPEEAFDVEEFKKSTVEEAQKAVMEKIAAGLGLTKEEKKQVEEDGLVPPWEQRGETKPKSWKEHAEYASDLAEWKRNRREQEIAKVQEENEKEAKEVNKRWNDYWDSELSELEESGKLPKVVNQDDPNDPGKKARVKLFAKMQEIGLKRQSQGLPPITSVKLVYYEHYEDDEPGGADAPVSFGKKGVGSSDGKDYSYFDIHGKSVEQIKRS